MKNHLRISIFSLLILPVIIYGQQLENPGFENWEDAGTVKDEPVDWSTIKTCDEPGTGAVAPVTFERSEDAHSGNYSLKLYNVYVPPIVATGAITNGRFHAEFDLDLSYSYTDATDPQWYTPFTAHPDSLVGWFKFFPQGNDAAQFKVIPHIDECKLPENGTMPNWVGMAVFVTEHGVTYDTWTRFSVPFHYFNGTTPEYVLAVFNSGDSTTAVTGSYLLADDLQLVYSSSGISDHELAESFLFVARDRLTLDLEPAREYLDQWFYLIDVKGQTVFSEQMEGNQVMLPSGLTPGIYVALLNGRTKQHVQKVMIQ